MKLSILVAFAVLCVMVVLADPAPEPGKVNKPVHQATKRPPHRHRREPEPAPFRGNWPPRPHRRRREPVPQPEAAPEPGKPNRPVHQGPKPKPMGQPPWGVKAK